MEREAEAQSFLPAGHSLRPLPSTLPQSPTCAHFPPPEKAQESENAFNSETHEPGSQST